MNLIIYTKTVTTNLLNSNLAICIGVKCWCDFGANLAQHYT